MVHTNPLCRLDKSNVNAERQIEAIERRWDKIQSKLEILQKRVMGAADNANIQLSSKA